MTSARLELDENVLKEAEELLKIFLTDIKKRCLGRSIVQCKKVARKRFAL